MSEFNKLLDAMYERDRQTDGLLGGGDDGGVWNKGLNAGGDDDYSAFLNLDGQQAPLTASDILNSNFFTQQPSTSASAQATPSLGLLNSTASSLLTSFDSVPGTDATLLLSDFSPELEMLAGLDMFPQVTSNGNLNGQSMMGMSGNAFDTFGCEPAFDYPGGGMFSGMSMFGGIPQGTSFQTAPAPAPAPAPATNNNVMSSEEMEKVLLAAGFDLGKSSDQDNTTASSPLPTNTASPREMFAAPPMEMQRTASFSNGGEGFGIAPNNLIIPSPTLSHTAPAATVVSSRAPPSLISAAASPAPSSSTGAGKAPRKKRSNGKPYEPTGVRNKVLLGPDAPTQSKNYLAPGSTTKKLIPVGFQKKLKISAGSVDGLGAEDVDKEIMDEIEEKRRKNCVAARESRKRKQDYLNGLKGKIGEWEQWAMNVERVLREQGLSVEELGLPEKPEEMDLEE